MWISSVSDFLVGQSRGSISDNQQIATSQAAIIGKRDLVLPSTLPGSWRSEGCYM